MALQLVSFYRRVIVLASFDIWLSYTQFSEQGLSTLPQSCTVSLPEVQSLGSGVRSAQCGQMLAFASCLIFLLSPVLSQ